MAENVRQSPLNADAASKLSLDRTRLSYERTMLSWIRTAIALITFGFSVHQFFRLARAGAAEAGGSVGPHEFGMVMIVAGLLALLLAALEHRSAMRALKAQCPVAAGYPEIPRSRSAQLAALIAVLGLLALVSTIVHE
jgi:putative membrane protein